MKPPETIPIEKMISQSSDNQLTHMLVLAENIIAHIERMQVELASQRTKKLAELLQVKTELVRRKGCSP